MALIDRVKFDGINNGEWLVCKYPSEDLSTASKLIVSEGQVAVLCKGGEIVDTFKPGTYTLSTDNIPIIGKLINLPYGGKTPFTAEVYFINTTSKLNMYWGTKDPIQIIDPKFNIRLRIRAFGQFGFKINNYSIFLRELIGALGKYQVCNHKNILEYFRGFLITRLKTIIASEIIHKKITALDITVHLDELSEVAFQKVQSEFDKYGIKVVNFFIESINFPEEDFEIINRILLDKAAFDIIGDTRYNTKRSFDIYEKAAENEGGVGSVAANVGIGLGLAGNIANSTFKGNTPNDNNASLGNIVAVPKSDTKTIECTCGNLNSLDSKFCNNCGNKILQEIICTSCGKSNSADSKFCSDCGNKFNSEIKCKTCGNILRSDLKFCTDCGTKVGDE